MRDILKIKLKYNYEQFDGIFYYWLYLTFEKDDTPSFFDFEFPDGREIKAMVEATYLCTADFEKKGIATLRGTKAAQILADAYRAPDLDLTASNDWHGKLLNHASQYYKDNLFSNNIQESSLCKDSKKVKTLKADGIVKLLLLRKVSDDVINLYN